MYKLAGCEPQRVFEIFEEISNVPRCTYHIEGITAHCIEFAEKLGLPVRKDEAGNVIITKPGTEGYESSEPVILQGHLDMVAEKLPESTHDFLSEGIELYVEDGFVRAKGTTLGGDNGIAVAMAMAVLESKTIAHPPIIAIFTADEEEGMSGAEGLDFSQIPSRKVLNMDSEAEGIITAGCAGGIQNDTVMTIARETVSGIKFTLSVSGLSGGHSGMTIHEQRGNAIIIITRMLTELRKAFGIKVVDITGGSKNNVIPSGCVATFVVEEEKIADIQKMVENLEKEIRYEFADEEAGMTFELTVDNVVEASAITDESVLPVLTYVMTCPNGVIAWNRKLKGVVETSVSIGIITTEGTEARMVHLIRSSVESEKELLYKQMTMLAEGLGGKSVRNSDYPAWQFAVQSELRDVASVAFEKCYGHAPEISVVHCGLECGIFTGHQPDLDCISFGPDILDVHSTNEHLDIASVERTWKFLVQILEDLK